MSHAGENVLSTCLKYISGSVMSINLIHSPKKKAKTFLNAELFRLGTHSAKLITFLRVH